MGLNTFKISSLSLQIKILSPFFLGHPVFVEKHLSSPSETLTLATVMMFGNSCGVWYTANVQPLTCMLICNRIKGECLIGERDLETNDIEITQYI